jgi:hypothetical protein
VVVALTPAPDPHLGAAQIPQNSKVSRQKNSTARHKISTAQQKNSTARQKNPTPRQKNSTARQISKVPPKFLILNSYSAKPIARVCSLCSQRTLNSKFKIFNSARSAGQVWVSVLPPRQK